MEVASTYKFCPKCGGRDMAAAQPATAAHQHPAPQPAAQYTTQAQVQPAPAYTQATTYGQTYASFWRRLGAYVIDGILMNLLQLIWILPAMAGGMTSGDEDSAQLVVTLGGFVASVLYFTFMESGKSQATLGKRWLGLKVVDENGQRITPGNAFGRFVGKVPSIMLLGIGFLMVFWTKKRQALHDKMAGTYVVYSGGR